MSHAIVTPGEQQEAGHELYVAWTAPRPPHVGHLESRGLHVELRRWHADLDKAARDAWHLWAQGLGGSTVVGRSDEGVVVVPLSGLAQVTERRERFLDQASLRLCWVGLGRSLDQALAARAYAVEHSRPLVYWTPEIAAARSEELEKGDHEGFAGPSPARIAAPAAPMTEASEHSEGEAARHEATETSGNPPPPEMTHAARDLVDQFHALAQEPLVQGGGDEDRGSDPTQELRAKLAKVLEQVRAQAPVLAQLKAASPAAWRSIEALIQGVIALGRATAQGDQEQQGLQKSVRKSIGDLPPGRDLPESVHSALFAHTTDYSHLLEPHHAQAGYRLHVHHDGPNTEVMNAELTAPNGDQAGHIVADMRGHHVHFGDAEVHKQHRGLGLGRRMYEAMMVHGRSLGATHVSGDSHSEAASRAHQDLSARHGMGYVARPNPDYGKGTETSTAKFAPYSYAMDAQKAELPASKWPPIEHHLQLPPGSMHDSGPGNDRNRVGRVKVEHGDGSTSWIQARAGQIAAVADRHAKPILGANAHPLSSRNPTGR